MNNNNNYWYNNLKKSSLTPPNYIFPVVWTILYIMIAISGYSYIKNKVPTSIVNEIFQEAVNIEKEFITESIPCAMIGMNASMMIQYIEFVADRLLLQLGYDKIWKTNNPFDFMELISLRPKTNFFELRVGEYTKSTINENNNNFSLSNDF